MVRAKGTLANTILQEIGERKDHEERQQDTCSELYYLIVLSFSVRKTLSSAKRRLL